MKPRLLLLSDLWGIKNASWLKEYSALLSSAFEIKIYDVCMLGQVDMTYNEEVRIHKQFVSNGIKTAVKTLLQMETGKVKVLAFSIGGIIAWKAALRGLNIDHLYAISSTRLRYETQKPKGHIRLYFGENDIYQPDAGWVKNFEIPNKIYPNKKHEMYAEIDSIHKICADILKIKSEI